MTRPRKPSDKERLVFVLKRGLPLESSAGYGFGYQATGWHKTQIEAIDAGLRVSKRLAMKASR